MKVLSIFGTRPEAIKMAPLVLALRQAGGMDPVVCVTGQHRTMLDQVMEAFGIRADHDLDLMVGNQTLNGLCGRAFAALDPLLASVAPDLVLVHGDTSTAMTAALAAFHRRIPVAHVEAGLRTGDIHQPWPEEMNRRAIDVVADYLFAPTASSRDNLLAERLGGRVVVTGNTVIDALRLSVEKIDGDAALRAELDAAFPFLGSGRKLLLVTGHRRENFGGGFEGICAALQRLAQRSDVEIVYPVHLNPNVQGPVHARLGGLPNVHLIAPLGYLHFIRLMQHAHGVLTDSGGVQEEAPALGRPVLVMREVTERPEAVAAGAVRLVGTRPDDIVAAAGACLDAPFRPAAFDRLGSPYGDGHAVERIVAAIAGRHVAEFAPAARPAATGDSPSRENTVEMTA